MHFAGKILLTVTTVIYTFVTSIVDLNPTHTINANWVSHSGLQIVRKVMMMIGVGLLTLYLPWFTCVKGFDILNSN
jgi:hypothetical protein